MTPFTDEMTTMMRVTLPERLFPAGHLLMLHARAGLLECLAPDEAGASPRLVEAVQMSGEEARTLGSLLICAPALCPYEVALAWLSYLSPGEQAVERCRLRLQEARRAGSWEEEVALLRSVLSTLKVKLQVLGLTIAAVLETGYILHPYRPLCADEQRKAEGQE